MMDLYLSRRLFAVWKRNLIVYSRLWKVDFLVPLFEPLFFIAAFGIGLSGLVGSVAYAGVELSYVHFIAQAILAISIMFHAFYENTFASFVRMYYQKTFDAMLATPLSLEEVVTAEIMWGATKAVMSGVVILIIISLFGFAEYPGALMVLPLAFLGGFAFGALGMFFNGITPSIDIFNLPIFLLITPLFLFSGTFFPVAELPPWGQYLALATPLYHLVELTRLFTLGEMEASPWLSIAYLLIFTSVFYVLSLKVMRHRLIK